MKKLLLVIMLLVGAVASYAQTDLAGILKKSNENLPSTVTDGMVLNSIKQADGDVVFAYTLADDVFANLKSMQDILRDAMVAEIVSSPDPMMKSLVAACKAQKANILQVFTNSSGDTLKITITPADME